MIALPFDEVENAVDRLANRLRIRPTGEELRVRAERDYDAIRIRAYHADAQTGEHELERIAIGELRNHGVSPVDLANRHDSLGVAPGLGRLLILSRF